MTAKRRSVLVVTRDVALTLAIGQLRPAWRVGDVLPPSHPGVDILVVDLQSLGLEPRDLTSAMLRPQVVIATEDVAGSTVLRRPFSADHLVDLVEDTAIPAGHAPAPVDPTVVRGSSEDTEVEHVIDLTVPQPAVAAVPSSQVAPPRERGQATAPGPSPEPEAASDTAAAQDVRAALLGGARAAQDLASLVDDFPLLADVPTLRTTVVDEARILLDADIVALWEPAPGGFVATAVAGGTIAVSLQQAYADHPLLHEITCVRDGLLIVDTDAARATVAGLGGTHTSSLIAVRVGVTGPAAVLVAGRDATFTDADLDRCLGFADEAGPMLDVARSLARLGDVVAQPSL
jgi:hypothetical protein